MANTQARSGRPSIGDLLVLGAGVAVVYLGLKVAMINPIAFLAWGMLALFWVPLGILVATLILIVRRKRPRFSPISVTAASIGAIALLYWGTDHSNELTPFNLLITCATFVSMFLTGLLPVLIMISRRQERRSRGDGNPDRVPFDVTTALERLEPSARLPSHY